MAIKLSDEETIRYYLPTQPEACFETLYSRYVGKVYQQCLSMTNDSEQAQDFTQDIFLKVFHKLDRFEQRSSFSTWLYSVAYNYCADQLRIAKRLPTRSLESSLADQVVEAEQEDLHAESLQRMSQALGMLSEAERQLLRLKYEQGKSVEAIAQLYGLKVSAIKMRLRRVRRKAQRFCAQAG